MTSSRSGTRTSRSSGRGYGAGTSTTGSSQIGSVKSTTPSTTRGDTTDQTSSTPQEKKDRARHDLATATWATVSYSRITIDEMISQLIVGTCGDWAESCLDEYSAFQSHASDLNSNCRSLGLDPTNQDVATDMFSAYLIGDREASYMRESRFTATPEFATPISKFTQTAGNRLTIINKRDSLTEANICIRRQEKCMAALRKRDEGLSTYAPYGSATESKAASTGNPPSRLPPPDIKLSTWPTQSTAFTVGASLCAASLIVAGGTYLTLKSWKDQA